MLVGEVSSIFNQPTLKKTNQQNNERSSSLCGPLNGVQNVKPGKAQS